jgi:hypothetical protein
LVGINVAQGGGSSSDGFTAAVRLDQFASWIAANTIVPPTLFMQPDGTNVVLTWSGDYTLQSSTNLNSAFLDVPGATSPRTNSLSASPQGFFRLRSNTNSPAPALAPRLQSTPAKPNKVYLQPPEFL